MKNFIIRSHSDRNLLVQVYDEFIAAGIPDRLEWNRENHPHNSRITYTITIYRHRDVWDMRFHNHGCINAGRDTEYFDISPNTEDSEIFPSTKEEAVAAVLQAWGGEKPIPPRKRLFRYEN